MAKDRTVSPSSSSETWTSENKSGQDPRKRAPSYHLCCLPQQEGLDTGRVLARGRAGSSREWHQLDPRRQAGSITLWGKGIRPRCFGAALDAGRDVQIVSRLAQGPDYPVLLSFPESAYLKGAICRVWQQGERKRGKSRRFAPWLSCAPGGTRTPNLRLRRPVLCPLSYWGW